MTHRFLLVVLSCLLSYLGSGLLAQEPTASQRQPRSTDGSNAEQLDSQIELGQRLFESPLLSSNRKLSCATCHDPDRGFAEGLRESIGVFEIGVGRNAPTLIAAKVFPGFVGPPPPPPPARQSGRASPPEPVMIDLEERCITPIENPLEMGSSIRDAIATLGAVTDMKAAFNHAFGNRGGGITRERIAKALAAYVRSLEPPPSPYRSYLEGDKPALDDASYRGLALFDGPGNCTACHSGPALSDGLFHTAFTPRSFRAGQQMTRARERFAELSKLANETPNRPPGGTQKRHPLAPRPLPDAAEVLRTMSGNNGIGYYNIIQIQAAVQTPSLWEVARTAPYFRDGSVADLETAVRQHIVELREVKGLASPRSQRRGSDFVARTATGGIPQTLLANWPSGESQPAPADLTELQIQDIVTFLRTLSPQG